MLGRESSGRAPLFVLIVCLYMAVLCTLVLVVADPPQPFGVAGWIFEADGSTQVALGTFFSINNTNLSVFLQNETRVPFPGETGRYSEVINGSAGDFICARAWNATHWGFLNFTLTGDMDGLNISLNQSRVGEPNVDVLLPPDNQLYEIGDNITIQANLTISVDKDALNCNATVTFTTPGVIILNESGTASQFLGNLSRGAQLLLNWSANASEHGITDITVTVVCDDNETGFLTTDSDTADDISVSAIPPPSPHGIAGWIFDTDGSMQMPLGTYYEIHDYNTGFYMENETRIPFPGYTGRYSEVINGSDGDIINVTAWNASHWGFNTVTLAGDMGGVNVSLNTSRPSETNVTITFPPNGTGISKLRVTNVTARVQIIGGSDGGNCSVTVSFSNESVVNITSVESYTKSIGNITLWDYVNVSWNVTAEIGITYIVVNASCETDGKNFQDLNSDNITANITLPSLYVSSLVCETPVNLQEATTVNVQCNATVYNNNLAANITLVNATFYDSTETTSSAADDNNDHYTNTSCTLAAAGEFEANYTCTVSMQYYANNGTWTVNVTTYDNQSLLVNSTLDSTYVNSLFALSAGTELDFGNLEPKDTSATDVNLTLTNTGNMDINISVYGYGSARYDNLSMNCSLGNISVDLVHYYSVFGQAYSGMASLTNDSVMIADFILYQRTDDSGYDNDQNETYWKIQIPMDTKGFCNGTVIASASAS